MRELILSSSVVIPGCRHLNPRAEEVPRVYTTAKLGWKPVNKEDPNGPQFATLWGDPAEENFGAVVQFPVNSSETYALVRRTSGTCACGRNAEHKRSRPEASKSPTEVLTRELADAIRLVTTRI